MGGQGSGLSRATHLVRPPGGLELCGFHPWLGHV